MSNNNNQPKYPNHGHPGQKERGLYAYPQNLVNNVLHVLSTLADRAIPTAKDAETTTDQAAKPPGSPNAKRQRRLDEPNMTTTNAHGNDNLLTTPQSHDAP